MRRNTKLPAVVREFHGDRWEFTAVVGGEVRADGEEASPGTLTGRIVPYDVRTKLADRLWEVFEEGSLAKTMKTRGKTLRLFSTHATGVTQPIGIAIDWREEPDGMYVTFKLARTQAAEDVRMLVLDGISTGLSIGFWPIITENVEDEDGVTMFQKEAKLDHVSVVYNPAHPGAQVHDVRSAPAEADLAPIREALKAQHADLYPDDAESDDGEQT